MKCFVIIGYGKKPSYANDKKRELDLDQTYKLLIKPVFDELNIECYRAVDKNLTGSIDKLMLREIRDADIALADISTLNANVMWELGVRHALKPRHTIMICEKEQMNAVPFDVKSFVIYDYAHTEHGIPYTEVERFREKLKEVVQGILARDPNEVDSPVFTFLEDELELRERAFSESDSPNEDGEDSFASIIDKAENAKKNNEFKKALEFLDKAKHMALRNMTLNDNLSFIIARQALCTYKSKQPDELQALYDANKILEELRPMQTQDTEVLGLSGAINKRIHEITGDMESFDLAISFYERGFFLKRDYYNGINVAYMLYKKASILKEQDKPWQETKLEADYIRNSVVKIVGEIEKESDFSKREDALWVLLTAAEAYNYKGDEKKTQDYEKQAATLAEQKNDQFDIGSYQEQKAKINDILEKLN